MDYSKYQIVKPGDFAMNHMDLLTGGVGISETEGVTSPDYRVFSLIDKNSVPEYYLKLFELCYGQKIFFHLGQGSSHLGRWRLPAHQFNLFMVPYPPKEEQKAIVEFIEKQLNHMSAVQEKAEQGILLFKEKRSSNISAAVTGKNNIRDEVCA